MNDQSHQSVAKQSSVH